MEDHIEFEDDHDRMEDNIEFENDHDTVAGGSGTDGSSDGTPRVVGIVLGSIAAGFSAVGAVFLVINRVKNSTRTTTVATNPNPAPYQPNGQVNHSLGKRQMIDATGSNDVENQAGNLIQGSNNHRDEAASVPDTPKEFSLVNESVTETTAEFRCKPGPYPTNGQTICLRCLPTSNRDKRSVVEERKAAVGGHDVQIKIKGLIKGCHYRCFVFSEFNNISSALSSTIEVQTLGNPHTPSEVEAKGVTSSLIEVSWKPGKYHRHTQTFVIECKNLEDNFMKTKEKFDDGNQTMTKTIKDLQPKTKYSIVIFAKNEIGESERTDPLVVQTLARERLSETLRTPIDI